MTYRALWESLLPLYDAGEARAIVRLVLEERFGMSMAEILCDGIAVMGDESRAELDRLMTRLRDAEPVQYVLGEAQFMGRPFHVEPGVLIPRPETETLCRWVADDCRTSHSTILDIGCGSGCIAVTLALEIGGSAVTACDLSAKALAVTRVNATSLGADLTTVHQDALHMSPEPDHWDVIVSNPPYICRREQSAMHANVTRHEPAEALYVPDEAPLLFYDAIATYASVSLKRGSRLYFECNPLYLNEVMKMLEGRGYDGLQTLDDPFGKKRFIQAIRP